MNGDNTIDFVIPLHRYHNMVRTMIEAIHMFYNPRNIYIITPKDSIEKLQHFSGSLTKNKIIAIPEETFFIDNYELSIDNIKSMYNNDFDERSREFGWWYQQIIKLGACKQIVELSDPFVVWDSDLVPFIKWDIYPTYSEPYYKFALLQEQDSLFQTFIELGRIIITDNDKMCSTACVTFNKEGKFLNFYFAAYIFVDI